MNAPPLRLLLPALLCIACLLSRCSDGSADATRSPDPIAVDVIRPLPLDASGSIAWSGTMEASESIPLTFGVVGTVARVLVHEGDAVQRGRVLAMLDTTNLRHMLDMAVATEAQAADACSRLQPMFRNGTLPEIKMIEAESNLARARAAVVIARKNLQDCFLTAPASGVIGMRSVEPGMSALPNVTSITIVRMYKVLARISVSEQEISGMRAGLPATVQIGALGDAALPGTIAEVGVLADPVAHTYPVKIALPNDDGRIRPGMICRVQIPTAATGTMLVVPVDAMLVDETGRQYVFVADGERALRRNVVTAGFAERGIAIRSGLTSADRVIVSGRHKLTDHAPIRVVHK